MPTIVVLDRSLSMRRPASRENRGQTRHDLARRGLEWLFDHMAECFPLEYTCLLSFSACDVLHPFTRNYDQLKAKLEEVTVQDRTNLHEALQALSDVMLGEWGPFAPCQAVVVTDGAPGVRHQDSAARRQLGLLSFPFPLQLHVVCVALREELAQPHWAPKMDRLCETTGLSPSDLFVPAGPLCAETVLGAFRQLAKAYFSPFSLSLKCGHLQSRVSLVPSPSMHMSKFDLGISPEVKFPRLDSCLENPLYPDEVTICGFLDTSCIPVPSLYARHFVLDPPSPSEEPARTLSPTAQNGQKRQQSDPVDRSQRPSFRVLLHGALKMESKAALVKLGWVSQGH